MTSLKLVAVCFLALVASTLVESCPTNCKCGPKKTKRTCPDTTIGTYFDEVYITVDSDYSYIQNLIDLIQCKKDVSEYAVILELWAELQRYRQGFDNCYSTCQDDIYKRIIACRKKYSPSTLCYNERVVVCKKLARRKLRPDLCQFRRCYNRLLPLIEELISRYNIDCQPRAISCPRPINYNFGIYFPKSRYVGDITSIFQTCYGDYLYLNDIFQKMNWPDNCDINRRCKDRILQSWIDFIRQARCLEVEYYPRIIDCGDNIDQLDIIYLEYLKKLRCNSFDFGNNFYEIWGEVDDYCTQNNLPWIPYIDFDQRHPQNNMRGLYLMSPRLSDYFSRKFVTCRTDFLTNQRIWNDLQCKQGTPEWNRREEMLCELKRRLCEFERWLNRYIRNIMKRLRDCKRGWDIDFDNQYDSIINEIIGDCDKQIYPYIIDFRNCFYNSDNYLDEIINQRGIGEISRNIIPSTTYCYDITEYIPDEQLCELIRWFENCLRQNYFQPITDLIQLNFDQGCNEYNLRKKALGNLECLWKEYRKLIRELLCEVIRLMRQKNCTIGSDIYNREFERIRGCYKPRLCDIIEKFKRGCLDINGILDNLYKKRSCGGCKRNYFYVEASFSITVKSC